jgi:methyl-accepting chemotaxis protein
MTRADIETMLHELATTTRYLQDSGRLMREAAEHMVTVSDHLSAIAEQTDRAITAGLMHLHGEDEGEGGA